MINCTLKKNCYPRVWQNVGITIISYDILKHLMMPYIRKHTKSLYFMKTTLARTLYKSINVLYGVSVHIIVSLALFIVSRKYFIDSIFHLSATLFL